MKIGKRLKGKINHFSGHVFDVHLTGIETRLLQRVSDSLKNRLSSVIHFNLFYNVLMRNLYENR